MIVDALKFLRDQTVAALRPKFLRHPDDPPDVAYLCDPGGKPQRVVSGPKRRAHHAASLAGLLAMTPAGASLWYSRAGVTLLYDDADRRDRATFALTLSKPLHALEQWAVNGSPPLKQGDFIRHLRTTFAGCCADSILALVRRVKWKVGEDGESALEHGKVSVGKSIQSQITGTDAIPEEMPFDLPAWANHPAQTYRVVVALEPDAATQTFRLFPLPGQVEGAVAAAEEDVRLAIVEGLGKDAGVKVFHGAP